MMMMASPSLCLLTLSYLNMCHWVFSSKLLRKLKQKHFLFRTDKNDDDDDEINNLDQSIPLDSPPLPPSPPPPSSCPFSPSPSFPQRRQWYSPPSSTWSRWITRGRALLQRTPLKFERIHHEKGRRKQNDVGGKMGMDKKGKI